MIDDNDDDEEGEETEPSCDLTPLNINPKYTHALYAYSGILYMADLISWRIVLKSLRFASPR